MNCQECGDKIPVSTPIFNETNIKIKYLVANIAKVAFSLLLFLLCACSTTSYNSETNSKPEYENPYLMEQISDAVLTGDDAKAREIAEQVKDTYPDTLDSAMADTYISIIDKRQKTKNRNTTI